MSVEIYMPKYGLTMKEGTIVSWLKKIGDVVEKGETVAEATSEKITNDIEAPVSGILEKIIVEEGETADVGAIIAYIAIQKSVVTSEDKDIEAGEYREGSIDKKINKEISLVGVRKTIADRMTESLIKSPQATITSKMDMSCLMEFKQSLASAGSKVTLTDLIVKVVAVALKDNPIINSSLEDGKIKFYESINIGVAVAVEDKLFVPVVKNVQGKNVQEISQEIKELSKKARIGELTTDEMIDGTFTVSNMGMFDVEVMTPIINLPEAAILAVGRTRKEVVVGENDNLIVKPLATFSLTIDHAVIDGLPAAKFLESIKNILNNPKAYF